MSRRSGGKRKSASSGSGWPASSKSIKVEEVEDEPVRVTAAAAEQGTLAQHDGCHVSRHRCNRRRKSGACTQLHTGGHAKAYCCRKCAPNATWYRDHGFGCSRSKHGSGWCCPVSAPMHETDNDVRRRGQLAPFANVNPSNLRVLPPSIRGLLNNGDTDRSTPWRVYGVDATGDCFFDCVVKAYNSMKQPREQNLTVSWLRWRLAMHLTADEAPSYLEGVMGNMPPGSDTGRLEELKHNVLHASTDKQRAVALENVRAHMMHRTHWASAYDLIDLAEDTNINIVPIVVNADYHNPRIHNYVRKLLAKAPIMPYGLSEDIGKRPDARYVLLYNTHSDEDASHYELLVRTDRTRRGGKLHKTLWTDDELPPHIRDAHDVSYTH